jgi:hypothetical protein
LGFLPGINMGGLDSNFHVSAAAKPKTEKRAMKSPSNMTALFVSDATDAAKL